MEAKGLSSKSTQREMYSVKCPYCGRTFGDFIETGLVGCEHCYSELNDLLLPYIAACQPSSRHPVIFSDKQMAHNRYILRLMREREDCRGKVEGYLREGNLTAANEMLCRVNEISAVLARDEEE